MNGFDSDDPRDEALWELLGRSRPVPVSPFFARKVQRALAEEAPPAFSWPRFLKKILLPAAACTVVAGTALVGVKHDAARGAVVSNEIEFETIQNLDLLVFNYESSLWLESSSSY